MKGVKSFFADPVSYITYILDETSQYESNGKVNLDNTSINR